MIKFLLTGLIIYLIIRFTSGRSKPRISTVEKHQYLKDDAGEFVEYEEIDEQKRN